MIALAGTAFISFISLFQEMLGPAASQNTVVIGSLLRATIRNWNCRHVDFLRSPW